MMIRNMFADDINRNIGGVVRVDQDDTHVILQEVNEYVITRELRRHFAAFFNYYSEAFQTPTDDIGVWISGFFGSGKSHFLKMLSYLLENREIDGTRTVERFRAKFADDPATFMNIDASTRGETETILFNIDAEGPINKDKTAVLRVFAKMFYNHLGFYGENLKVAKLEQFIAKRGKTDDFRRCFAERTGTEWLDSRDAFVFFEDDIVAALVETLGMSETAARNWFDGSEDVDMSITRLVTEIKEYLDTKPKNFRLLFMVDEVGQYVGTDTNLLLNLQTLVEKIGSECGGHVWVVCTGQEAIDEIIRVRADEFSRIQARFKTRLSLSSSSVDEVIQKRILKKTPDAAAQLTALYNENNAVLRNLFSFTDAVLDIKGYGGPQQFADNFPFVPYQFIIMQKVFAEIRKHGNAGKHLSGGERSMLSGFQEAAQKIQTKDEYALAPFYLFYDTLNTFLDGSITRVINRCAKAAEDKMGVEPQDVAVLKLLYLIRYVDDIPANLDNIVILMADDLRTDKITMREKVRTSLDRLISQNYIGRTGDVYSFLTDEEQEIQRDINNTNVDAAGVVTRIGHMIFSDIYAAKKYRYRDYDFPFDQMVDSIVIGAASGGMKLRFLTDADDSIEKTELRLMMESTGQALVVLGDTPYYNDLEKATKIRQFVKSRNVSQLARSAQDIIRAQQDEATKLETAAQEELRKAIETAQFYVDGEHLTLRGSDAKAKINEALEYLVAHVYSALDDIDKNAATDADIVAALRGDLHNGTMPGMEPNHAAAVKMEEYLEMQRQKQRPTTMQDIQSRYQAIPYGWREIDIAVVAAMLIWEQKVTIKYGGATVQPTDPKLPDLLRKRSEIGKTSIAIRQHPNLQHLKEARAYLRDYFDVMDVPEDEDSLVRFITEKFTAQREHYAALDARYNDHRYPDHPAVQSALGLCEEVLAQRKDNIVLIEALINKEDDLDDSRDEMQRVESFFKNQVTVFDEAVKLDADLRNDLTYLETKPDAINALNKIRLITQVQPGARFDYRRIPELNELMRTVRAGRDELLADKRAEMLENVRQCMEAVHTAAGGDPDAKNAVTRADAYYDDVKKKIDSFTSLLMLDGLLPQMLQYRDTACESIEALKRPATPAPAPTAAPVRKKLYKPCFRTVVFQAKTLETEADIDEYLRRSKEQLLAMLQNCDGVQLK